MTALLVVGLVLGWMLAAGMVGLWWGERGRREAAERVAVTGSPMVPQAVRLPDPMDTEAHLRSAGQGEATARYSEATIEKGVTHLLEEAKAMGMTISPEEARRQAMAMLAGGLETGADLLDA